MSTLSTSSNIRQQRTPYQPPSPSVPYRQQAYRLSSNPVASGPPLIVANSSSSFTEGHATRHDFYSPPSHNLYRNGPDADEISTQIAATRGILVRTNDLDQHYNRSDSGSSDPPLSPEFADHTHLQYTARPGYPESSSSKRRAIPDVLDAFSLGDSYSNFRAESSPHVHRSTELSRHSDFWSNNASSISQYEAPPKVKKRREKPRIDLAPDQPPTTQGKPRARVYVACLQCRNRKIRCDGAKPACHNCSRRTNGNNECNYDPIPKRRGPDKVPGARQRMARDARDLIDSIPSRRRRRTRADLPTEATEVSEPPNLPTSVELLHGVGHSVVGPANPDNCLDAPPGVDVNSGSLPPVFDYSPASSSPCGCHGLVQCPADFVGRILSNGKKTVSNITPYANGLGIETRVVPPYSGSVGHGYLTEVDEDGNERQSSDTAEIGSEPSLNFSRKIWWDSLLSLYLSPTSTRLQSLTVSQRESASQSIATDIRFIFRASNYWFSFFHIPSFFSNFFDPARRERVQPSLVLALLAISTFWQSSEIGYGANGRERALRFRDEAQAAMDASFNSGWIDETLAQAAWLLAFFEVCAHPRHSSGRSTSSMVMLDSIIRSLSLTIVDADDPNISLFPPGTVPTVDTSKARRSQHLYVSDMPTDHRSNDATGCSCRVLKLQEHWPSAAEHTPLWSATPAWDQSWTDGEIRKESCRRLCWSSMVLAAGHISYTTAQRSEGLDLFISDPANYALLFSGESVARSPMLAEHSSKDTIWALYDRSYLLWHGCIRMRKNNNAADDEKADFAMKTWLEADSLEQALNRHTCALERAFIFQAREYIFNTRMCISYEFQRYIPLVTANVSGLFHRQKAEEWLTHQATVAERFMLGLHTITGNAENLLARRPFFVFWFMGQIHRAIALWECDRSLTVALDVCKALIPATDYLTALWPCPEQRLRYESLREKVVQCCLNAGLKPPSKFDLAPPPPSSPEVLI